MKRGRKSADEQIEDQKLVKSTYLLSPVLKQNLAYLALAENTEQSDVVREAIAKHLKAKGLDPEEPPVFNLRSTP